MGNEKELFLLWQIKYFRYEAKDSDDIQRAGTGLICYLNLLLLKPSHHNRLCF